MLSSLRICARKTVAAAPSAGNKLRSPGIEQTACRAFATVPGPRLFDYETVTSVLKQSDAVEAVEAAFGMLAKGKVDVPLPMHIGIDESASAGPGDCHIKGGYISGTSTWTVKLANVSFYKNIEKVSRPWSALPCSVLACLIGVTFSHNCKKQKAWRAYKLGTHTSALTYVCHDRHLLHLGTLLFVHAFASSEMCHSRLVFSSARAVSSSCSR